MKDIKHYYFLVLVLTKRNVFSRLKNSTSPRKLKLKTISKYIFNPSKYSFHNKTIINLPAIKLDHPCQKHV